MSTQLTPEQLKELIIATFSDLRDAQSNSRMAKKSYEAELQKTDAHRNLEQAKRTVLDAKAKLEGVIANSPELTELADDVKYYNAAVTEKRELLSKLLVRQAVKSGNASVDIGDTNPHAIILKATLGQEAPEQLDLFDDDSPGVEFTDNGIKAGNMTIEVGDEPAAT